ncbi:MAG TPA: tyrosine-protein phosphatase [Dokdonella sp.]
MPARCGGLAICALAAVLALASSARAEEAAAVRPPARSEATAPRNPVWASTVDASRNLYRITDTLYRSERLTPADVARLRQLGVRTVINLRAFHSGTDVLAGSGIRQVRIPILTWKVDDAQMTRALRELHAAQAEGPTLLHCQHGADRTGLVAAMYRMAYQGWSKQQALEELQQGGYGFHPVWKNIPRYIRHVDLQAIRHALGIAD